MKDAANTFVEVNYTRGLLRVVIFLLANVGVAVFFSALWVWQYHIDGHASDQIDDFVVPWGWLAAFFTASFVSMHRLFSNRRLIFFSLGWALLCSFFLFLVKTFVLVPLFDPMF
jgi:hypothetical protein